MTHHPGKLTHDRLAAFLRTLAASLRTSLTRLVVRMRLAFRRTLVTRFGAQLGNPRSHRPFSSRDRTAGRTDVRAIQTQPNALRSPLFFKTGCNASQTCPAAIAATTTVVANDRVLSRRRGCTQTSRPHNCAGYHRSAVHRHNFQSLNWVVNRHPRTNLRSSSPILRSNKVLVQAE